MNLRLTVFLLLGILFLPACVATGTRINDRSLTSKIVVDKSTSSDVAALLGLPEKVAYGGDGGVTWQYFQVTEVPRATNYLPLVRAWADGFCWQTRKLIIAFDKDGLVKSLERQGPPTTREPEPY